MTRVLVLKMGGTIAGVVGDDVFHRAFQARDLLMWLGLEAGSFGVEVDEIDLTNVDSAEIGPTDWEDLAAGIHAAYDDFDGFVITHGTNTLAYTAAALSFAFVNLDKPVVITGAQQPFDWPASDALANLVNAVRLASWGEPKLHGVLCVFGSQIISGARAKKVTDFEFDAFQSSPSGRIGRIGRAVELDHYRLARHHAYSQAPDHIPGTMEAEKLVIQSRFEPNLLSLTEYPGMPEAVLRRSVEAAMDGPQPVRGVVFRAFGDGDVSTRLHRVFSLFASRGVPVVVTTQVPSGNATMTTNPPGRELARSEHVVPARDMSIEAMTTKLAWLLAQHQDLATIREQMLTDLRGELGDSALAPPAALPR